MTFREASDRYLKGVLVKDSIHTYRKISGYLKRACELIGDYDCKDIDKNTLHDVILYRRKMNPNITNKTLNIYLLYIQVVLRDETDILIPYKKLREIKKIPKILDEKVIDKVFKYLDGINTNESKRNKLMFNLLLDTGLRISELLNITLDDVDFMNNILVARNTKTREYRQVLFTESTKDDLLEFAALNRIEDYIFINLKTRKQLHPDSVQTICQRIREKAKINQSITPHKWRHTFASRFIDKDGNQFVLMKLLGHKKITTTQIYVQVSMKKVREEYMRIIENR